MDTNTFGLMAVLAPDLMEALVSRAMILERISILQPVGRRALAQRMGIPEREARMLTDLLREDGLIDVSPAGMALAGRAYEILDSVRELVRSRTGLNSLETQLQKLLRIGRVCIVPGDADTDPEVLNEVGRVAGARLRKLLEPGQILAVNGGTTVHSVATHIPRGADISVTVLPARGGLGRSAETQANTLAELIAERLGGRHKPLYLPDNLPQSALKELIKLDEIREPLEEIKRADVLLYGIARADEMARNRLMSESAISDLVRKGAVAEALGHCFDISGRLLASASGLGLPEDSFSRIPNVIAVAAGSHKAEAILAVSRHHKNSCLITDEGAANRILEIIRGER
ncbi:MAG: hypothetical protein IK140_03555 [Clostridia bacterium]|jgi:central glycolytic genes regulator|nr:hypothetical protein [Clostridia bacterium]